MPAHDRDGASRDSVVRGEESAQFFVGLSLFGRRGDLGLDCAVGQLTRDLALRASGNDLYTNRNHVVV